MAGDSSRPRNEGEYMRLLLQKGGHQVISGNDSLSSQRQVPASNSRSTVLTKSEQLDRDDILTKQLNRRKSRRRILNRTRF